MAEIASVIVGLALVLAMLRDMLHELFAPEDTGSLSRSVMHATWRVLRWVGRRRRSVMTQAGAIVLLAVAGGWTSLLALGFALVYLPFLPEGFTIGPGVPPEAAHGFATALYVSVTSMTTLNASEITPLADGLRLALGAESLIGMGLVTAWITWVLSIYPVLAHRRAFAREVALVQRAHAGPTDAVTARPRETAVALLRSLTEQVLRIGAELAQSRVTYYFQNSSRELALASQLPYVLELARAAERCGDTEPALRHHGTLLRMATESLLADVGRFFLDLRDAAPEQVLDALARDHLLDRARSRARASPTEPCAHPGAAATSGTRRPRAAAGERCGRNPGASPVVEALSAKRL